ncbi:MAG: hypothetical protein ACU0BN_13775 [Sulfitobacter sp.]
MGDEKTLFKAYVGEGPTLRTASALTTYQKRYEKLPGSTTVEVSETRSVDVMTGELKTTRKTELNIANVAKVTVEAETGVVEGQVKRGPFAVGLDSGGGIYVRAGHKVSEVGGRRSQEYGAKAAFNVFDTIYNVLVIGDFSGRALVGFDRVTDDFLTGGVNPLPLPGGRSQCFLSDTTIQMWPMDAAIQPGADGGFDEELVLSHVWQKPISKVEAGDVVVAFDEAGRLQPGTVARTMTNDSTHILDFWGTGVTPGHACYCADGPFAGRHVPILDILRSDGALMRADGSMVRAATNCDVGSDGDRMIHASASMQKSDGSWTDPKISQVRFGTKVVLPDGRHSSLQDIAEREGWGVSDDGYMVRALSDEEGAVGEQKFLFPYLYAEALPQPEDYILTRSDVTLEAIYAAGEWEQIGTNLSAPESLVGLNTNHTSSLLRPSKPAPNIPKAFSDHPDAPNANLRKVFS